MKQGPSKCKERDRRERNQNVRKVKGYETC